MALLFTCPRCGRSYAVPDAFAGLICPCSLPLSGEAPSPTSTSPGGASPGAPSALGMAGGARPEASVSTGRARENRPTGPPRAPVEVPEAIKSLTPSQDDFTRAEGWMASHYFKKDGVDKPTFLRLLDAAKGLGYTQEKDGKLREYIGSRWKSKGGGQAQVVRLLIAAGAIEAPKDLSTGVISEPPASGMPSGSSASSASRSVLEVLDKWPNKSFTPAELAKDAGMDEKAVAEAMRGLLDSELAYEPVLGRYRSMKGAE